MLILHYKTKKELKAAVGKQLVYTETSLFGEEWKRNTVVTGTKHPKRSWYATITIKDGLITRVS